MSAPIVVLSAAELAELIEAAVARAVAGVASNRLSDEWVTLKACGFPRAFVMKLVEEGKVRCAWTGREHRVSTGDLRVCIEALAAAKKDAPAVPEVEVPTDPFEAARARAKMRRAS